MTAVEELHDAARALVGEYAAASVPTARFPSTDARAFVLEAIWEGFLCHYGDSRALRPGDADLELLAGDAFYALGLARLAEAGDTAAVTELADLISICARTEAEERPDLSETAWQASADLLLRGSGAGARGVLEPRLNGARSPSGG